MALYQDKLYVGDLVTGQVLTFNAGDTQTKPWLKNEIIKHSNSFIPVIQPITGNIMDGSISDNVFYAPYMQDSKLIAYNITQ